MTLLLLLKTTSVLRESLSLKAQFRSNLVKTPMITKSRSDRSSTSNTNPSNFVNRPKEVQDVASKGGQSSAGGFASMDPNKQVCASRTNRIFDCVRGLPFSSPCIEACQRPFSVTLPHRGARLPEARSSLEVRGQERRAEREDPLPEVRCLVII